MVPDLEYFRKRLADERALAVASDSEQVRTVHRKLADLYAERLDSLAVDNDSARDFHSTVHTSPVLAQLSPTSRA